MKHKIAMHTVVYNYYEARISGGLYSCGDRLPSLVKMSQMFHMAPDTIRAGLALLEKQGYIQLSARRAARVVYQIKPAERKKRAAQYFTARETGIKDICLSYQLLLEPIFNQALSSLRPESRRLLSLSPAASADIPAVPVRWYFIILDSLQNELNLNFFWEALRYLRFPYLVSPSQRRMKKAFSLSGVPDAELPVWLETYLNRLLKNELRRLFQFINASKAEFGLENEPQIPFHWGVYRRRPQLCYSLVSDLLCDVAAEKWSPGEYLPSLPQLAGKLNVSVSTVRRALRISNALGITCSQHGKGTQVLPGGRPVDFSLPEVQEGLRFYRESLQLLALTIRGVLLFTLREVSEAEKRRLEKDFLFWLENGKSYYAFELCHSFIYTHCPAAFIREYYKNLHSLLIWGYPLTLYRIKKQTLHQAYRPMVARAAVCLQHSDWPAFAELWEALLRCEEETAAQWLPKE